MAGDRGGRGLRGVGLMKSRFEEVLKGRRSIRTLGKSAHATKEKIEEILKLALYAPSAYNAQTSRIVVLMDGAGQKFWDIAEHELRKVTPPDAFARTVKKLNGFRGGNGTLLFYEDMAATQKLKKDFPLYQDKFDPWAQHNNAILQYAVWLALYEHGIAASVQHYDPLVDADTAKQWDIPENWTLIAQMPFGKAEEAPPEKNFMPFDERVRFYE